MNLLPVIDLQAGTVVRGVGGRRGEYRSLVSRIVEGSSPGAVARAFSQRFGMQQAYIADLDAIAGCSFARDAYADIAASIETLWIDAGIGDVERATEFQLTIKELNSRVRPIIGLESLVAASSLPSLGELIGWDNLVFSLDLRAGRPITRIPEWQSLTADEIASHVIECGMQCLIVLDLADVGSRGGVGTLELCRRLRRRHRQVKLIAGGGVRHVEDLIALENAGCDQALVASALHEESVTVEDIQRYAGCIANRRFPQ